MREHGERVHGLVLLQGEDILIERAGVLEGGRPDSFRAALTCASTSGSSAAAARVSSMEGGPRLCGHLDDVHHELERLAGVIADERVARGDGEVVDGGVGEVGRELPERDAHGGGLGVAQGAVEVEEHGGGVGVDGRGGHRDATRGADEGGAGGGLRGGGIRGGGGERRVGANDGPSRAERDI